MNKVNMLRGQVYGDISLPFTYKMNYVNMQVKYVDMWLISVDMQHK